MVHTGSIVISNLFNSGLSFSDIFNLLFSVPAILREVHVLVVSQDSLPLKAVYFIIVDYLISECLYSMRTVSYFMSMFITKLALVRCDLDIARPVLWDCTITDLSIVGLQGRETLRITSYTLGLNLVRHWR